MIKEVSIYAHNVNGLLTKITDVFSEVVAADFDIYVFTETRLNDSIDSCRIFPSNDFIVYRCDRSPKTSNKHGGGGVLIGAHKRYKSELILSGEEYGCEQLWIQINCKPKKLFLGVLYIPPNSNDITYMNHMKIVKDVCKIADNETTIALYGDFNMPMLEWYQSDIIESTYFPVNIK